MLATLASDCRPHGATPWDATGIMAAIVKVKDRSLADVILAVIRAADDRDAKTPGVITAPGSMHWRERGNRPAAPEKLAPEERCGVCAKSEQRCKAERVADDDHTFEPDFKRPSDIDTTATVGALRELVVDAKAEPTTPTPRAEIRGRHESEAS